MLNDKDCENVYELVYSSHRAVAQSAGEFLNAKLFVPRAAADAAAAVKALKTKKGKKRSENTPLVRDLVQFFIESEVRGGASRAWSIPSFLRCVTIPEWCSILDARYFCCKLKLLIILLQKN